MARGNNGENVLNEEIQKNKYSDILALYKEKIDFKLYAYCIMNNHIHLLIEVNDTPLSQIMQRVQQVYTQWFNRKYNRTGHVFQQRYKALLCDKENYLLQLVKYIHNNPVKVNLRGGIEYRWSSHIFYIGKKKDYIVDTSYVLSIFSENMSRAIKLYQQFMNQEEKEIKYIDVNELQSTNSLITKEKKGTIKTANIDEIIKEVCNNENVLISDIIKKTRVQKISDIRKAIVLLGEKYCNTSNKILTEKLNLSSSMISKIKSGDSKGTDYVEEVIRRWEETSK